MADSPSTPLLGEEKEKEGGGRDRQGLKTEPNTEREGPAETLGHKDKGDGGKSKNGNLSGEWWSHSPCVYKASLLLFWL